MTIWLKDWNSVCRFQWLPYLMGDYYWFLTVCPYQSRSPLSFFYPLITCQKDVLLYPVGNSTDLSGLFTMQISMSEVRFFDIEWLPALCWFQPSPLPYAHGILATPMLFLVSLSSFRWLPMFNVRFLVSRFSLAFCLLRFTSVPSTSRVHMKALNPSSNRVEHGEGAQWGSTLHYRICQTLCMHWFLGNISSVARCRSMILSSPLCIW